MNMSDLSSRWWFRALLIAGLVAAHIHAATAGTSTPKLKIEANEPFVVDGRLYPAGTLSVRRAARYSPVLDIDELRLGTRSIGFALVRHDPVEWNDNVSNRVVFERNTEGQLVLVGYVLRNDGDNEHYRLVNTTSRGSTYYDLREEGPSLDR
jgi:hypothetical protein